MSVKLHYDDYVSDEDALRKYDAYQDAYRSKMRESDSVLIDLIAKTIGAPQFRLLDIGCSTGNLLFHLKNRFPSASLTGGDLAQSSIDKCRADPALAGIAFDILDMCDLAGVAPSDVIVANAVAVYFDWETYARAARSVCAALKPGGTYVAFEWMHPFSVQDITIIETSEWHPQGLKIHFRPMRKVEAVMREAGFCQVEFHPFELPIDLPFGGYDADVGTYTRKDENGHRMAFRGALYQPWCHLVATKAG